MRLRSNTRAQLGALVFVLLGCSSSSDRPQHGDAGVDSSGDAKTDGAANCSPIDGTVFAVDTLYFGDMDWDGYIDASAWMLFGSDLDGLTSDATSTDLCQPAGGALPEQVYPDGDEGVDNAFGKTVVPLLSSVSPNFSERVNDAVANGLYTWLFKLDPFGPNQASVSTKVFATDALPSAPMFDGSDCWPVSRASLKDVSDIESAKISFPGGKLVANRLSTGSPGDFQLMVPIAGTVLRLTAHHAKVAIDFEDDPDVLTRGTVSGVVDTEEFIEEARDVLGFLDPTMCSGSTFDAMASSIRRASDIMKDGTQDPSSTCDGISVGIGFTMIRAGVSGVGPATDAGSDPCP